MTQINYVGEPAVRIPYLDANGEEILCTRFRVSLDGKPKIKTKSGDKLFLYGLWMLPETYETGYAVLVEGESDTQTLWHHGRPAVGIPGANGWKAEWATHLEGIERRYFVVEDAAGEALWRKLVATPEIRERLYRVELDGAKDVSELHKRNAGNFDEKLSAALKAARAWLDIAETEEQERARDAWEQCRELAEAPDILAELVADLNHGGLVGEKRNAQLLYLALTSRLLDKIVSVVVKGPSSAGKNHLVKSVMGFFPPSACWFFSGMSERTLFYTEEPLSHRHIVIAEAAGVGGEFQDYVIRTLVSEGFLEYEFVEKTPQGMKARRLRKDGPTGFLTTTTRNSLFWENETRYLSLTVEDTREQTRRVFRAIARERIDGPDLRRWLALQVWIEGSERRVLVPFALELANKISDAAVRLRRDFSVLLSLVKAHAILHQATRDRDAEGRIVATLADYAAVRDLVADLLAEGIEATVPPTVRETVEAVEALLQDGDAEHVSVQELADELNIDKSAASRRARGAIDRGYLENLEDRRGRPARLILGNEMPQDAEILPAPEKLGGALDGCAVDGESEGIQSPLPHSKTASPRESGEGYERKGSDALSPIFRGGGDRP